ncbi:MAG: Zn-ribbon domain-containing OB-fold protein [Thermoplasmata archaeon]
MSEASPPQGSPRAAVTPPPVAVPAPPPSPETPREARPFLLDFFPLEGEKDTRLARFFVRLAEGHLSTTRCAGEGRLLWPPRTACPYCHSETLEWVDLPAEGRIYAFSAVLAGAPLGMESEVPFSVGLVDLDGGPLRLFGRIEGRGWESLRIGGRVRVEPYAVGDGRWFYRFRALD